jgi:hypothetical protein
LPSAPPLQKAPLQQVGTAPEAKGKCVPQDEEEGGVVQVMSVTSFPTGDRSPESFQSDPRKLPPGDPPSAHHDNSLEASSSVTQPTPSALPPPGDRPGDTAITRLTCGHVFHRSCLDDWMSSRADATCPMCRELIAVAPPPPPDPALPTTAPSAEYEAARERAYQARLRYYLTRLHERTPGYRRRRHHRSPTRVDQDVDYLYANRYTDWYMWDGFFLYTQPAPTYVSVLPSFGDTFQRTWQMQTSMVQFGGSVASGFASGGGAGGGW